MPETILAAILAFAATNVDDLFINTFFFAQADMRQKTLRIALGKFLGMGTLFALSLLGAFFAHALPYGVLRLLGLVPIALGLKAWFIRDTGGDAQENPLSGALLRSAAAVTVANGGDNIGVYMPLLAEYGAAQIAVTALVFALLTALWCFLGQRLSALPALRAFLTRYGRVLVPVVLIVLGGYILI